jgi:hypothetical protein
LFLKIVNAKYDADDPLLVSEVDYYAGDYLGVDGVPLVRCYDAVLSEDGNRYHLLLDDLSGTHDTAWNKSVTLEYGFALADAFAILHAAWWNRERLDSAGKSIPEAAVIEKFVGYGWDGLDYIIDCCSDELEAHWPQLLLDIFEHHPRLLIQRTRDVHGFTLIHGDVSPGNILVPIDADGPIYITDRAPFEWSLTTWLGVYDLSYAIVTFWGIEPRRHLEHQVLEKYLAGLIQHGVNDYTWEQLQYDYRLTAPMSVYVATEWCRGSGREHKEAWLPMLRRALTACDDLECATLWAK